MAVASKSISEKSIHSTEWISQKLEEGYRTLQRELNCRTQSDWIEYFWSTDSKYLWPVAVDTWGFLNKAKSTAVQWMSVVYEGKM